jgi:hypothetical protein
MSIRAILLCLLVAGCTSWRTQGLAPQQVVAKKHPGRIRITLTDSSVVELKHPVITADSIAGKSRGTRISVASDRIARTEIREVNEWKSIGAMFLYMVAYSVGCNAGGGSPDCAKK